MKKLLVLSLTVFGGLFGFAYYYFIGCTTGTCPLTSNPISSTIYGGIMGSLLALTFPFSGKKQDSDEQLTQREINGPS